jgi:hypothetical protein
MAVSLSPIGGAASQFFNGNGVPLSGGKMYTYEAGTTTPKACYTSSSGLVAHSNPIILDSTGRVPTGEIWLTSAQTYLFVLKSSNDTLIGTWDNIYGYSAGTADATTETQVATSGQTDFVLTTMAYTPGTNTLQVYIDGVNQVVNNAYTEVSATLVTFVTGLHVGAVVKFLQINSAATSANLVTYQQGVTATVTTVEAKLQESVSVKDFGAVGDGVANDSAAVNLALAHIASNGGTLVFPKGTYLCSTQLLLTASTAAVNIHIVGYGAVIKTSGAISGLKITGSNVPWQQSVEGLTIDHQGNASATAGFECTGTAGVVFTRCSVVAYGVSATYGAFWLHNTTPANNNTGCFWTTIEECFVRNVSGHTDISYGIKLDGAANATNIANSHISVGVTTGIGLAIYTESGLTTQANSVLVQGTHFEGFLTAVDVVEAAGFPIFGLRLIGNRFESGGTILSLTGNTAQPGVPTYLAGNYIAPVSVTTYLNNPNNLYVTSHETAINATLTPTTLWNVKGTVLANSSATYDPLTLKVPNLGSGLALANSSGTILGSWRQSSGGHTIKGNYSGFTPMFVSGVQGISLTDTDAKNLRGTKTFITAATAVVTFSPSEPDASYFLAIAGSANETFWVTGKGTTGFTINSSNAASTATVTWILIR